MSDDTTPPPPSGDPNIPVLEEQPEKQMGPAQWLAWGLLVAFVATLMGVALWRKTHAPEPMLAGSSAPKPEDLAILDKLDGFTFIDQNGDKIDSKDLLGEVWVANFVFTRCFGTCPLMTRGMAALNKELADVPSVKLISFSMDPEYDTPNVLKAYAEKNDAVSPRWHFLTGKKQDMYAMVRDQFHLMVSDEKGTKDEPIVHSIKFILIDAEGRVRGRFDGLTPDGAENKDVKKLANAVRRLRANSNPYSFLAPVNASLNATSFFLLMLGFAAIKRGRRETHKRYMTAAGFTTLVFLACYLFYHYNVGHVPFRGPDAVRLAYFVILVTHVFLAVVVAVMAPITFFRAHREQWEAHKRIAKITFPIWLYVSVTGVIVYVMVYHMY
jgi:protein SCO1/2/putative membrane protein